MNKSKLDWFRDSFDRKFMREFFEEFVKVNGLPKHQWQIIQYEDSGYLYQLRRINVNVLNRNIPKMKGVDLNKAKPVKVSAEMMRALREGGYLDD